MASGPNPIFAGGIPPKVILDPIEIVLPLLAAPETTLRDRKRLARFVRQQMLAYEELLEEEETRTPARDIQPAS